MPPRVVRKTATKVVDGRVSRKNRSAITSPHRYCIERFPAGRGFTHVVSARQLNAFIDLIPDRGLFQRLERIILTNGDDNVFGYHAYYPNRKTTIIALKAWPKRLWRPLTLWFFRQNQAKLEALGVEYRIGLTEVTCRFTIAQARAFTLLDVFMHELGHQQDWQHRRGVGLPGKEDYAEEFANAYFPVMHPLFCERFGDPRVVSFEREDEESVLLLERGEASSGEERGRWVWKPSL